MGSLTQNIDSDRAQQVKSILNDPERAKELLIASNMSILDICEATGYEEQSYFTRIFKRYQGMSPNAFRMKTGKYPNDDMEIHN